MKHFDFHSNRWFINHLLSLLYNYSATLIANRFNCPLSRGFWHTGKAKKITEVGSRKKSLFWDTLSKRWSVWYFPGLENNTKICSPLTDRGRLSRLAVNIALRLSEIGEMGRSYVPVMNPKESSEKSSSNSWWNSICRIHGNKSISRYIRHFENGLECAPICTWTN